MIRILCIAVLCTGLLASCSVGGERPAETITPVEAVIGTEATATPDNTTNLIGEEKAKEIALRKAGLSFGEVIFDRVELEKDDGIWHYEIEFKKGRTEYDADINATDGVIIGWEIDIDD